MKGILNLNSTNIKSAIVYGILTFAAIFFLSILQSVLNAGTIFGLNWKSIFDSATVATIPSLIAVISLLKNILTTDKGNFLGVTKVIPDNK